ncbi:c-type cytochrome [Fibrobacterota bacterium]
MRILVQITFLVLAVTFSYVCLATLVPQSDTPMAGPGPSGKSPEKKSGKTLESPREETQSDTVQSAQPDTSPPADSGVLAEAAAVRDSLGGAVLAKYQCLTCHSLEQDKTLKGPGFYDVGKRLGAAGLYQAIVTPGEPTVPGCPVRVTGDSLVPTEFYQQATVREIKAIVDFLVSRKGTGQ